MNYDIFTGRSVILVFVLRLFSQLMVQPLYQCRMDFDKYIPKNCFLQVLEVKIPKDPNTQRARGKKLDLSSFLLISGTLECARMM